MLSKENCATLLQLPKPWRVDAVSLNPSIREMIVDISIQPNKKGWFSRGQRGECPSCGQNFPLLESGTRQRLRHMNLGLFQVYLRFYTPRIECRREDLDCPFRLAASPSLPFTAGFAQQLEPFWHTATDPGKLCHSLGLSLEEFAQLKQALGSEEKKSAPPKKPVAPKPQAQDAIYVMESIPDASDPLWLELVNQQITLRTKNYGLQMLLSSISSSFKSTTSHSARISKINMLRTYFVKNQYVLHEELKQLFEKRRT